MKSKHPLYRKWYAMIYRCTNPKYVGWKNYGGRGVKVCKRWMNFENFVEDMYPTFMTGFELDRINNNKNYTPSNCKWSTHKENSRNQRRCMPIDVYKKLDELGIHQSTYKYWAKKLELI